MKQVQLPVLGGSHAIQGGMVGLISLPVGWRKGMLGDNFTRIVDAFDTSNAVTQNVDVYDVADREITDLEGLLISSQMYFGGDPSSSYLASVFDTVRESTGHSRVTMYAGHELEKQHDEIGSVYAEAFAQEQPTAVSGFILTRDEVSDDKVREVIARHQDKHLIAKWHVVSAKTPESLVNGLVKGLRSDAVNYMRPSESDHTTHVVRGLGWKPRAIRC